MIYRYTRSKYNKINGPISMTLHYILSFNGRSISCVYLCLFYDQCRPLGFKKHNIAHTSITSQKALFNV